MAVHPDRSAGGLHRPTDARRPRRRRRPDRRPRPFRRRDERVGVAGPALAAAPAAGRPPMSAAVCLVVYGVVVAGLAPRLLMAQAASGRAPRLGVLGWFIAVATVL